MTPIVSIIMGSTSDLPVMEKAAQLLNDMHVPFEMNALSAHRTPEAVEEFAKNARNRGIKVIIAAAGMAAALPGVIAANTTLPVTQYPDIAPPTVQVRATYTGANSTSFKSGAEIQIVTPSF